MSIIISTFASCLADFGLELGKEFLKNHREQKKLRKSLISFIKNQSMYNEMTQLSEEIDFQGLIVFICNNLLEDEKKRILCLNSKKREEARQIIIDKAIYYSKADTPESKLRVSKFITNCLDIIEDFYKNNADYKPFLIAADIIDEVNNNTTQNGEKIKKEIVEDINREVSPRFFSEYITEKANRGDMSSVNDDLRKVFAEMSNTHPLFPYYGYSFKEQAVYSEPRIPEALEKYPIRYKFTGPVRIGDRYINSLSKEALNYAYRHQLKIVMRVDEAKKYLGGILDPYQFEAEKMVGAELSANPPEFPPAFACSLKVKNQVCFDYVLIRAQEILDDGTIILSNKEQPNTHLRFEFRVNIKDFVKNERGETIASKGETGFNISISEATNEEILKYVKFIKAVITERELSLRVLENNQDLIKGKIDNTNYETGFRDIDEEIDFLERVCDIEHYFSINLKISGEILLEEYNKILLISDLIRKKEIKEKWKDLYLSGDMNVELRKILIDMIKNMSPIPYIDNLQIDVFGTIINLKVLRIFYDAIIEDCERIKKLVEELKDGEPIKITFKPGENNKVITSLYNPEELKENDTGNIHTE